MFYLDWTARLDNFAAAVSARLSQSEPEIRVSNVDALKLCYFTCSLARFLFIVQPPRNKWVKLFITLLDRIDSPAEGNRTLLDEDKASVADHMLTMMRYTEQRSLIWTSTNNGDEEAYEEWVSDSRREEDSVFPDRLFESIAPYCTKTREFGFWGVRRALDTVQMKTEETV